MSTPNKNTYEQALETVKKFEERKQHLQKLNNQLAYLLKQFDVIKFKVNKKEREVIFTGFVKEQNKLVLGQSKCKSYDVFEEVIGKLIAVKKAVGEDIEDVVKLVESNTSFTIDSRGLTVSGTLLAVDSYAWNNTITRASI